jgi:predicted metal-dependent hydrolase
MTSDWLHITTSAGVAKWKKSSRKSLAISVLPDGSLELLAPMEVSEEKILAKVEKRRNWIEKQRELFRGMNEARVPLRFVTGSTHRYLGKQYRLKIERADPPKVLLKGGYFIIRTPDPCDEVVEKLLKGWLREKATEQFSKRIEEWHKWCARSQVPVPRMKLRDMPKRWGSASTHGVISLNPQLVTMPSICIDYVITHEICHLRYPDHGPKFQRLLTSLMPQWRRVKQRLEET